MPPLERPFDLLARGARRRAVWLGLPLLLYVWTITGPFVADDLHLVLKAESYLRGESPTPGLFRFARTPDEWHRLRDRGDVPWWTPAAQRADFFRPLAEWSFCLDMLVFGRHALGHRLVSLAWFAIALVCTHRLFRVAGGDPVRAGVATLLYGISQTLTQPATFICNRSDLFAVIGTTLAAGAYWRAMRGRGAQGSRASGSPGCVVGSDEGSRVRQRFGLLLLAIVAYAFALLSKEIALGLAAAVVGHQVVSYMARRRRPRALDDTGDRRLSVVIAVVFGCMAAAYLDFYAMTRPWHLGLGSHDSINNVSTLSMAPRALALHLAVWTVGFPISALVQAATPAVVAVGAAGILGAVLTGWYLVPILRRDAAAVFFLLWAGAFLGIALLTIPETRVLSVATLGWAYLLIGLLIPSVDRPCFTSLWLRHWLLATNGAVSICCAIALAVLPTRWEEQSREALSGYVAAASPLPDGDTLIVARPFAEIELLFAGDRLEFMTGRKDCGLAFLTLPDSATRFRWLDDRTLEASSPNGDLLGSSTQRFMLGRNWKPAPGFQFEHRAFTVEVASVTPEGAVAALTFHFKEPITSPRLHFVLPGQKPTSPSG